MQRHNGPSGVGPQTPIRPPLVRTDWVRPDSAEAMKHGSTPPRSAYDLTELPVYAAQSKYPATTAAELRARVHKTCIS
jgi:hypothetical protein